MLTLALAAAVISPHAHVVAATDAPPQEVRDEPELTQGVTISREIDGGTSHGYALRLLVGESFRLLLTKGDLKVSILLYEPGREQPAAEFGDGRYGPMRLTSVTRAGGLYRVVVSSHEADGFKGAYTLSLESARAATDADRVEEAARAAFYEAERLRAEWKEESIRNAVKQYEQAAAGWRTLGLWREAAGTLERAGDAYFTLSEYDLARNSYAEALSISRDTGDAQAEAMALNGIGYINAYTGKDRQALAHFQAAVRRLKEVSAAERGDEDRRAEARALSNMGEVYYSRGDLKRALSLSERALALWTEAGDRGGQALALLNGGLAYGDSGETQRASEQFERALSLWRAVRDARGEALALSAVAGVHSFNGRKRLALETYRRALDISRLSGDRHGWGIALNGIARSYEDIAELPTALDFYKQALDIFHRAGNTEFEVVSHYCIGSVYRRMGQAGPALEHYRRSVELSRQVGKRRMEAYALLDIAAMDASRDDANGALAQYARILRLYREIGDRRGQAVVLTRVGDVHLRAGRSRLALDFYRRALPLYQQAKHQSGEAATFYNIALSARADGNAQAALANVQSAIDIVESLRVQVSTPAFRSSYFASVRKYYGLYIDLLMRLHAERPSEGFAAVAFEASERARARVLLESLIEAEADLRQGVDPELLKRERALQQLLSTKALYQSRLLSGAGTEAESAEVAREMRRLEAEYQEVEARIRQESPRYASVTQPEPLRLRDIQQELGEGTLLLEYTLGDERSYVWAVSRDGIESAELPGRAELEKAARDLYDILRAPAPVPGEAEEARGERAADAGRRYWESASSLGRTLLCGVAGSLGDKRLLVVADGALQYIPFETLPAPDPAAACVGGTAEPGGNQQRWRPMVVEHEILSLPSASMLVAIRREQRPAREPDGVVAVLADPVFEPDDPRVKVQPARPVSALIDARPASERRAERGGIENARRLPFTRREADYILSLVPEGAGMLATGFDANLATARSPELGRFEIVHFATHGIFNNAQPESSGLLLSLVDEHGNPEDGFLHLHDIYDLDLPAKLVVLSGCDTGLGKDVNGEGLVGLTHAFMYAGSKSVLASLWKVDDEETDGLMRLFYKGMLKDGLRPAAALRAAKVASWERDPSSLPYAWGAFILEGEFAQTVSNQGGVVESRRATVFVPCAALALLLFGWAAVRFRRRRLASSPK